MCSPFLQYVQQTILYHETDCRDNKKGMFCFSGKPDYLCFGCVKEDLYIIGDIPVLDLKKRLKAYRSENPVADAISLIERLEFCNSPLADSKRIFVRYA